MYEKILVPLDGSELAERALPYVAELAKRLGSEAILLTVATPGDPSERILRSYLQRRVDELRSLGARASLAVVPGDAAKVILDFANTNAIDLIVVSAHGRGGPGVWPMGSIANKVLQRSRIPMILVKGESPETVMAEKGLRRILLLLDGSQFAEAVIPYAQVLAQAMGSEVTLLQVVEPVQLPRIKGYAAGFDEKKYEKELTTRAERKAKRYLSQKGSALEGEGIKVTTVSLLGKPSDIILQYAEDKPASLIALATHGMSGIAKWAYGSVASKIIEASSKPVFLVRPPLPASKKSL